MKNQIDCWKIVQNKFQIKNNINQESLFTLANGFIGMRGDSNEKLSNDFSHAGTFINGFFEKATIEYGESAYGFAKNKQIMLTVCNPKRVAIHIDDEEFNPETSSIDSYYRELDMQSGIETRKIIWTTSTGKQVFIENQNMVSMERKFVAVRSCSITPLNFSGNISITSFLLDESEPITKIDGDDPRIEEGLGDGVFVIERCEYITSSDHQYVATMKQTAKRSALSVMCAVAEEISKEATVTREVVANGLITKYEIYAEQSECICLRKYISYVTNQHGFQSNYEDEAISQALLAKNIGWNQLIDEQQAFFQTFWQTSDITFINNDRLTQSIRFNIFHLLQSTGRDSFTSTAAKGLSGEGYGGHYFWESEIYIAPVFRYSNPEIARSLLMYRYRILNQARNQARLLGHSQGALYSWRSIDGEECSAYFPAGSAQYHINADVALSIDQYIDASQDWDFLADYGLEILLETARIWIDMGHYAPLRNNQFCIDGITGPDEYTALINNNCYTNLMAREHLWNAVSYANHVKENNPEKYQNLIQKIQFHEEELIEFQHVADNMYIPYHDTLKIHMQDDSFLYKKVLDLAKIPSENFPLLLHYHPLFIYRHQVCKQPDLILAQCLLNQYFTQEDQKRNFDYYEKVTTHDSSLSFCVFSIAAATIGDAEKAYDYFMKCIRTDLDDIQKNTKDGLHMANMAGSWMAIVQGFAGFKIKDGIITFCPLVPTALDGYTFTVTYRTHRLSVEITKELAIYTLLTDNPIEFLHEKSMIHLAKGETKSIALGVKKG